LKRAQEMVNPMIDDAVTWIPPVDIYEIDNNYILNAEIPGVERRNLKIEFTGVKCTIRGERLMESLCKNENYHRLEGHRGRFRRSFSLPGRVDTRKIHLDLKKGVLHVVIPKYGRPVRRSSHSNR
jgi:HSP20 family protein